MLEQLIGDEPVIYLHDLGIVNRYRGQIPLSKIICPVLAELKQRSKVPRIFFWSIEDTRIYRLAMRASCQLVANVGRMQFFIGRL